MKLIKTVIIFILIALMSVFIETAFAAGAPLDEKIISKIAKGEELGFMSFGDIDGDKKDEIIISINKLHAGQNNAPESKLAIFRGDKIIDIDAFSSYIEKLDLIDVDGDMAHEIVFSRNFGVNALIEVYVLKALKDYKTGLTSFHFILKSGGLYNGKYDIIKNADGIVQIITGGYVNAPDSIAPHLEFSRFYSYDKKTGFLCLVKKFNERPRSVSQEYEYAYMLYIENDSAEAVKRLKNILTGAKNAKSEDNIQILKASEKLLSQIERVKKQ